METELLNHECIQSDNMTVFPDIRALTRDDLIQALKKVQDILLSLAERYTVIDELEKTIKKELEEKNKILKKLSEEMIRKRRIISGIVLGVVFIASLIGKDSFWGSLIMGLIPAGFVYYLLTVIYRSRSEKNPDPAHVQEAEEYHRSHITPLEQQREEKEKLLSEFMESPGVVWASNSIGEDYLDFSVLEMFISYLRSGRADNLKEAINLYEEEQHRSRMENMQHATMAAAASTAASAAVSARANVEAAANIKKIRKTIQRW